MSYTIKLLPSGHVFQAKGSQTIVEAAIDEGIHLPYGCRNGACGACKGKVVEGKVHWLTDSDFLSKYCTCREGFDFLTTLLQHAPIFNKHNYGPNQMPVKYQIMIWLHFFGHGGMTVESQRETLHTCKGLLNLARDRVTNAFNSIHGNWIHWPDSVKRKAIARRIEQEFFLPNCVAIMDGTLFPLEFRPQTEDAADYHGRKFLLI